MHYNESDDSVTAALDPSLTAKKVEAFTNDLNEFFDEVPIDYFAEQYADFNETIKLNKNAHDQFIKNFETYAEAQGLELMEVRGREELLGEEYLNFASSDYPDALQPTELGDGVAYYFKSPSGMIAHLKIKPAPIEPSPADEANNESFYDIVGTVEYGILPSHPLSRITPDGINAMINTRYQSIVDECTRKQSIRIIKKICDEVRASKPTGELELEDLQMENFRARMMAQVELEQTEREEYLAGEYERIKNQVSAELGAGDKHAEYVSKDEINESLHLMQKIHAATRETLIGLNIFEVPRDIKPHHRDKDDGGLGGDDSVPGR